MSARHWVWEHLPTEPPAGWSLAMGGSPEQDGAAYRSIGQPRLVAIVSGAVEDDGKRWLHLSVRRSSGLPSWEDMRRCKETFLGDRYACIVFPPKEFYVNIHPDVLHLWSCLDGWPLPEFSSEKPGIGRTV